MLFEYVHSLHGLRAPRVCLPEPRLPANSPSTLTRNGVFVPKNGFVLDVLMLFEYVHSRAPRVCLPEPRLPLLTLSANLLQPLPGMSFLYQDFFYICYLSTCIACRASACPSRACLSSPVIKSPSTLTRNVPGNGYIRCFVPGNGFILHVLMLFEYVHSLPRVCLPQPRLRLESWGLELCGYE